MTLPSLKIKIYFKGKIKMKDNKEINIVFITDDAYAKPTSVAMTSLLKNTDNNMKYVIYLISKNVSKENEDKFKQIQSENVKVNIIQVNPKDNEKLIQAHNPVSLAALLKFDIANILKDLDKALYLDGDIIVRDSLVKLYETNIVDYYCAAVPDGPRKKVVGGGRKHLFSIEPSYFNSGVMLLNLDKIRKDNIPEKLLDYRINSYNYFMDQDAFNQVFKGKVKLLPYNYNTMLHIIMPTWKQNSFQIISKYYDMPFYNSYEQYINISSIIHYTFLKPWKYYDIPMSDVWAYYYYLSPFKEEKLARKSFYQEVYGSFSYKLGHALTRPILVIYKIIKKIIVRK